LLEALAHYDVRATFFLIGEFVKSRPDIVRSIRAAGHLVGNHTMTHPVLLWQRSSHVREELEQCNIAIEDALGEAVEYFRPPHGARRPDVIRIARELGLTTVMWNAMGYDWTAPPAAKIVERVEGGLKTNLRRGRGSNVLLHDGSQHGIGADRSQTVAAVKALLNQHRSASETSGIATSNFVRVDAWALSG
jgi:peptidoglycan/xylan/chitin deacetylase (PgdA/CDA1 family)